VTPLTFDVTLNCRAVSFVVGVAEAEELCAKVPVGPDSTKGYATYSCI